MSTFGTLRHAPGEWTVEAGTLPGRDLRQDCEWFFVREQRHLIQDWIDGNGTAVADGDMADALIRAIGGVR